MLHAVEEHLEIKSGEAEPLSLLWRDQSRRTSWRENEGRCFDCGGTVWRAADGDREASSGLPLRSTANTGNVALRCRMRPFRGRWWRRWGCRSRRPPPTWRTRGVHATRRRARPAWRQVPLIVSGGRRDAACRRPSGCRGRMDVADFAGKGRSRRTRSRLRWAGAMISEGQLRSVRGPA